MQEGKNGRNELYGGARILEVSKVLVLLFLGR